MDCVKCGAPLPAKTIRCQFCGTRNDVDLRLLPRPAVREAKSARTCPDCGTALLTVRLDLQPPFELDRCEQCMGLFFDPGELEGILERSTMRVAEVDLERLDRLAREETPIEGVEKVTYKPCPECAKLMHRRAYGKRSGVIVDSCRDHGVWLDGGELRRLLHWRRAGGEIYDLQQKREEIEEEKRELERRRGSAAAFAGGSPPASSSRGELVWNALDVVDAIRSLIGMNRRIL